MHDTKNAKTRLRGGRGAPIAFSKCWSATRRDMEGQDYPIRSLEVLVLQLLQVHH